MLRPHRPRPAAVPPTGPDHRQWCEDRPDPRRPSRRRPVRTHAHPPVPARLRRPHLRVHRRTQGRRSTARHPSRPHHRVHRRTRPHRRAPTPHGPAPALRRRVRRHLSGPRGGGHPGDPPRPGQPHRTGPPRALRRAPRLRGGHSGSPLAALGGRSRRRTPPVGDHDGRRRHRPGGSRPRVGEARRSPPQPLRPDGSHRLRDQPPHRRRPRAPHPTADRPPAATRPRPPPRPDSAPGARRCGR